MKDHEYEQCFEIDEFYEAEKQGISVLRMVKQTAVTFALEDIKAEEFDSITIKVSSIVNQTQRVYRVRTLVEFIDIQESK